MTIPQIYFVIVKYLLGMRLLLLKHNIPIFIYAWDNLEYISYTWGFSIVDLSQYWNGIIFYTYFVLFTLLQAALSQHKLY